MHSFDSAFPFAFSVLLAQHSVSAQSRRTKCRTLDGKWKRLLGIKYAYNLSVMHIKRVGVYFFVAIFFFLRTKTKRQLPFELVFVVKRIVYIEYAARSVLTIDSTEY